MLTWHERLTLLMILDEKLNRLRERRQYYIAKLNTQGELRQTYKDIFEDLQEQIKELEGIYQKINDLKVIN